MKAKLTKIFIALLAGLSLTGIVTAALIAQSWDVTDFSTGQYSWENTYDDQDWFPNCPAEDLAGYYDDGTGFVGDLCAGGWPNYYYSVLVESPEIDVAPGGGKVRTYVYDCDAEVTKYNSTNLPVYQLLTDTNWVAASLDHPTEQNYWIISEDATKLRIGGQVYGGSFTCYSIIYTVEYEDIVPEGGGPVFCSTVDDYHFTETLTDTPWLLENATVASSTLTIQPGGAAGQNITATLLQSNRDYNAVISVTTITTATEIPLYVQLGSDTDTLTITGTGLYTANLTTGNIGGPQAYLFRNESETGSIDISWTCVYPASATDSDTCYGPPNGEFNNSDDWLWFEGASFNEATKSAFIPMNDPETHSDPFYAPAYITNESVFTMPAVPEGQYLILKFDAQALNNQNGLLTTLIQNAEVTDQYTLTYEIYPQKYTFETDVTLLANDTLMMLFGVNGGYPPAVQYPDDVNLDNVCFFLSDDPPGLPQPVDPDIIAPANPGGLYTCGDIGSILYGLVGVDLRYHHVIYNTTPSVWNPEDWVPWIISAWWVMVETILCFFFVLINSIINLLIYFVNEFLNWFNWIRRNAELIIPWIGLWLWAILGTWVNFGGFINTTLWNWLYWLAAAIAEFAGVSPQLIANLATIALWVFSGFWWLGGLFVPLILFFLAGGSNVIREIINFVIENGWNGVIDSFSTVISGILNDAAWIWNENLKPFFELILRALFGPIISLFALFYAMWGLIWAVVLYLWENIFQSINIPFAFYTGFNSGVQSAAFSSLMSCDGTVGNFWCNLFAGLDLLNGVAGQSIFYPIVIVGIILATIVILYKNVTALWNFYAEFITKI